MRRTRCSPQDSPAGPLALYLRDIHATPLLNADQEKVLARRVQQGDWEARDHLVRANLRLVVTIARGYAHRFANLQDLIQEGNLGLLRAVELFDPAMSTRFCTYASYWIRQSIRRGVLRRTKEVRLPAHMAALLIRWRRATADLHDELGRAPEDREVAGRLRLSRRKLVHVQRALGASEVTLLSEQTELGRSLEQTLAGDAAESPVHRLIEAEELGHALSGLGGLDTRSATILRMRFGLDDGRPKSLQTIGEHLCLTRERVRQIESATLGVMRMQVKGEG